MEKNLFAVIAAYNEQKNISLVLKGVKKYILSENIVVVDDGSSDNTYEASLNQEVTVLRNIINLGKGAALKTGCDYALNQNAKIIIVLDGDNQHDPKEIPHLLDKINQGYKIVFGYRKFDRNMPFILKLGNLIIKYATKLLYNLELKDSQCGYRAFTSETYKKIRWTVSDYSLESEMVANVGKHGLKYAEIPVETIYNDKYKGTTILDGMKIVINLFLWRLRK